MAARHSTFIKHALHIILIAIYRKPGPHRLLEPARRPCAVSAMASRFSPNHALLPASMSREEIPPNLSLHEHHERGVSKSKEEEEECYAADMSADMSVHELY